MDTSFNATDAEMLAELDAVMVNTPAGAVVTKKRSIAAQKRRIEAISEKAMECNGDTVATINRLLDVVFNSLDDSDANDTARTALCAVRHFHLPSLLDAFEVDISRAH